MRNGHTRSETTLSRSDVISVRNEPRNANPAPGPM